MRTEESCSTPMTSPHAQSPLKGIALVLAAVLIFASMDTVGKYLMTTFSVPLVAGVRYGINLLLLLLIWAPRHGNALWKTTRTPLVVLRGLALAAATFFAGLALQRMPVGETVSIIYLQGFGIMLAAGLFLKERVRAFAWLCAAAGFAGVVLIARPGGALEPAGVFYALICAAVSVVYILLSRTLAATETTMVLLFHVALSGTLVFGLMLAIDWHWYSFSPKDIGLLGLVGVASLAGHFLLTAAYRYAAASTLAPFNYFHIAFAVIAGWLVYDHVPDHLALLGMAMIAVSGAAIALHTGFTKRKD
jgi:drug/metabolite transporter (DMT)-like permease